MNEIERKGKQKKIKVQETKKKIFSQLIDFTNTITVFKTCLNRQNKIETISQNNKNNELVETFNVLKYIGGKKQEKFLSNYKNQVFI